MTDTNVLFEQWSDETLFRDLLARAWLYEIEIDWDSFEEGQALGPLLPLFGPMSAIELYGPAREMEERSRALEETIGALPTPPDRTARRDFRENEWGPVLALVLRVKRIAERLRGAERLVREAGWEFVPEHGRFQYAAGQNRRRHWQNKVAWAVYKARFPDRPKILASVREEVARILRWWLPEEYVDASADGPLDQSLRNDWRDRM